jgi:hypothetical protein
MVPSDSRGQLPNTPAFETHNSVGSPRTGLLPSEPMTCDGVVGSIFFRMLLVGLDRLGLRICYCRRVMPDTSAKTSRKVCAFRLFLFLRVARFEQVVPFPAADQTN